MPPLLRASATDLRSTATGIRTPVSGMRSQRPSPLDDSGEGADILARQRCRVRRGGRRASGSQPLNCLLRAAVAELVDAHGSGPCGREPVEVRLLSAAFLVGSGRLGGRLLLRRPGGVAADLFDEGGPEGAGQIVAHAVDQLQ